MESKKLFFYELEGRGYTFQNKNWDEAKHGFEDDMLNMAWEMWSSAKHSVKAQAVPEGFVLVEKAKLMQIVGSAAIIEPITRGNPLMSKYKTELDFILSTVRAVIEAQEQKG